MRIRISTLLLGAMLCLIALNQLSLYQLSERLSELEEKLEDCRF